MHEEWQETIRLARQGIDLTRQRIAELDETLTSLREHTVREGADYETLDVIQAVAVELALLHAMDANARRQLAALERAEPSA